jgi:MinD-like ATPase involved in chromosome partitioning or flagellar assembly
MAVDQFVTIVKQLSNMAKYIILDYGPSLPSITQATLEQCDKLLIVTEPYEITIVQTKALLDELSLQVLGLGRINVVLVNRIPMENQMSLRAVQERLGHSVAAVFAPVPELSYNANLQNVPMVTLQKEGLINQQFEKLSQLYLEQNP